LNGLRAATSLLTVIGRGAAPEPAATKWFCFVGLGLGAVLGIVWWAASLIWPPAIAAAVVLAADMALTGMLHLDGLADAADGLLPHMDRARRLEVMAQPDVGAFGVAAVALVLLARFAALSSLAPAPLLLAALWGASRGAMALAMSRLPYARPGGLAQSFTGGRYFGLAAFGLTVCAVVAGAWDAVAGTAAVGAGLVAAGLVMWLARRRVGGYTGDVLGASGVAAETAGLLAAAARW
jgi:adenosylcobinamide-GDP ribazoletransferase